MALERCRGGETALFVVLAVTLAVTAGLGAALFRPRKASAPFDSAAGNVKTSGDNILMFDAPVEQVQR
jgi:hypothetical protein